MMQTYGLQVPNGVVVYKLSNRLLIAALTEFDIVSIVIDIMNNN